jgi:hypothetical protein
MDYNFLIRKNLLDTLQKHLTEKWKYLGNIVATNYSTL